MIAAAADPTVLIESHVWLAQEEARKRRRLRDLVGDDEVLSAAMLALCQAANAFVAHRQGEGGFVAYARVAIYNRLKDCATRAPTRRWLSVSALDTERVSREGESGQEGGTSCRVSITDFLADAPRCNSVDDADEIRWALDRVPKKDAQILVMFFGLEGRSPMTRAEIAEHFNRSIAWTYQRVRKAVERLREVMKAGD